MYHRDHEYNFFHISQVILNISISFPIHYMMAAAMQPSDTANIYDQVK